MNLVLIMFDRIVKTRRCPWHSSVVAVIIYLYFVRKTSHRKLYLILDQKKNYVNTILQLFVLSRIRICPLLHDAPCFHDHNTVEKKLSRETPSGGSRVL